MWSVLNAGPDTMDSAMKITINSRIFDAIVRLRSGVKQLRPGGAGCEHTRSQKASGRTKFTLSWANQRQRRRVIDMATEAGLQTTNFRSMPRAKVAVLLCADGRYAGWAGMDAETDPAHPEVFSGFIRPEFRGFGLGALLEHVWWAYTAAWGCKTALIRLECGSEQRIATFWLKTGYCKQAMRSDLGRQSLGACRLCELFGSECVGNPYLVVDVEKALAVSMQRMGPLDICSLPIRFSVDTARDKSAPYPVFEFENFALPDSHEY
jgi:GNAT superfamily N-acetyltransferase